MCALVVLVQERVAIFSISARIGCVGGPNAASCFDVLVPIIIQNVFHIVVLGGCLNDLFSISCMHAYGRTPTMEAWNYHHTRNVVEPNTIINECINQLYLLLKASIIEGCKQAKC